MVAYDKPPIVKELLWKKIAFGSIFLIIGLALMIFSISECRRFRAIRDAAVTVTATICEVKEVTDGDFGTEYDVYVEYSYQGKSYKECHMTSKKSMWMDRVGQTLTLTINPEKPEEELDDLSDGLVFSMFFGLPIFCVGVHSLLIQNYRLTYVEMYGLRSSAIRSDLILSAKKQLAWLWLLLYGVGDIVFGFYIIDIDSVGAAAILLGVGVLILCVFFMVSYFKTLKRVKTDPYVVREFTVLDKRLTKDSDGDAQYEILLEYKDGKAWEHSTKKEYNSIYLGEKLTYIFGCGVYLRYRYDAENRSHWKL